MNRTTPFKGLDAVCKVPVHKYFSKSDTTESQGDVSKDGLGFILTQQDQPVTFANRALTLAEQKYQQIAQPPPCVWSDSHPVNKA